MERFARPTLTSSEAATLLDVHPSTVKRWCNGGSLRSEQTAGGHRRIALDEAMRFARRSGIRTILSPFHPYEPHVWSALRSVREEGRYDPLHELGIQWARRGEFERLEQLYIALGREVDLPFADFCDHAVRGLMARVGDEWQQGKLRVGDEHMVSQTITSALVALRRSWIDGGVIAPKADAPVAVVGTLEGNQHQLGAMCVRLLLERAGWKVFYPGADVPIEDFAVIQKSREATLVCVSLPASGTVGDVARSLEVLGGFYDRSRPYAVVFGGGAGIDPDDLARPGPFQSVTFLHACGTLLDALDEGLGRAGGNR